MPEKEKEIPFDKVDQKDINDNLKVASGMEKDLDKALKKKEDVLRLFDATMKELTANEKTLRDRLKNAMDRCKYHKQLKDQIDGGKIDPKRAKDTNDSVKSFIDVVEKQELPKFQKELDEFEKSIDEIKKVLK